MNSDQIRILVVDDHQSFRQGVAGLLATQSDLNLIAEAANGKEAIEAFRAYRPDITLMDLQMPGMNGLDAITAIRSEFPDARMIVLTTFDDDGLVGRCLRAGAGAFLLKSGLHQGLLETIRDLHSGGKKFPANPP